VGRLCGNFDAGLRPAPDQLLDGCLVIRSAYLHEGPARHLVHNFKYRGIEPAGSFLAEAMAGLVPASSTFVPVPRVTWRKLRYGIDPAAALATRLATLTGGRRRDLLVPPPWGRGQAGATRASRRPPVFRAKDVSARHLVIVDDVVTTGGTVISAWRALGSGPALVVSATSVGGLL
jgi:predicted amidophosphoribosyltransferase